LAVLDNSTRNAQSDLCGFVLSNQLKLLACIKTMALDWESKADAKRQAIIDSIPQKWRLDRVPSADEQKDVTDGYIHQFLSPREIEITETDIGGIAKQTATGSWTSVEVAEAFCHRASIAHQLVRAHPK
jgi:amidase